MPHRILHVLLISPLMFAGCSRTVATPTVLLEQTVKVSSEDPYVAINGKEVGVDGLPTGVSTPLKITHYRTLDGRIGVDIDQASEE